MVEIDTLREIHFFKAASEDTFKTLSMVSEEITLDAGTEIFTRGEPAEFLYFLTRGEVEIQYNAESGARCTVDRIGPGDLMVWSAVVEPHVHTSFGVAKTDGEAISVDADRLRQLMREDHDFGQSLMSKLVQVVASRLTGARRQLAKRS
ncbi:MAG: Crp/Fnr family transcriptional regulator [bacterium]|nr:Crp/Fnr family transcriptional regulator [bacterium]